MTHSQANPPSSANSETPGAQRQRRLLLGGVAVLAAAAGAALAWRQIKPHAESATADSPTLPAAETALWQQSFDTPAGGTLALQTLRGKPLLINFWATWCPPCIEELPLLERFYRENSANGWQVLGIAVDQPSSVKAFLQKMPLTFPNALAGFGGTELSKSLGNLTGALPFTVVLGASGNVLQRKMGQFKPEDLQLWRQLS